MRQTARRLGLSSAAAVLALLALDGGPAVQGSGDRPSAITLTPIGVYETNVFDGGGAEIAAYDARTKRLFVVNLNGQRVDVLDISDPKRPSLTHTIDVTPWGSQANSVATDDGVVAVAIEANSKTDRGTVAFFDAYGGLLSTVTVGALPDMVTFTPNGRLVLVANEGEPNSYNQPDSVDPHGSVSIIDLRRGVRRLTQHDVTTAGFRRFNHDRLDRSIRIYGPNASVAQDLEPEYIAVSRDSRTAWVTLQENNAIGILDLDEKRFTDLVGLGFKDHSKPGFGMDASDRDSQAINIVPRPVFGMYQPDGIAAFEHEGRTYLITANEGDVREWPGLPGNNEARRVSSGDIVLDPDAFPDAATLKGNPELGRLNVTLFNGRHEKDDDDEFERLYSFGGRSFSIRDARGRLIFDSGDDLEQLIKAENPDYFNANHTNNINVGGTNDWTRDSRSDDKGPEPENVTVARLFGRPYAFIVLERIGGVVIYDLSDPREPEFVDYVNVRTFGVKVPELLHQAGDLGPEGVFVIKEHESPNGKPLLVVANEVSGTTRIFEISEGKKRPHGHGWRPDRSRRGGWDR